MGESRRRGKQKAAEPAESLGFETALERSLRTFSQRVSGPRIADGQRRNAAASSEMQKEKGTSGVQVVYNVARR